MSTQSKGKSANAVVVVVLCLCECILSEQRNKTKSWCTRAHNFSFANRKRPGETKEKIKDQTPTQDDQGGNWHSKEPKSDGKRASDPGSSSSQKGDESMSVKDRKQKSEGGWVFRPRAYSELNNDNNKMAESSIGGSSPPLTIERAFDESQHHQKSNSKLEETPAVDRNQSQQKSRDRLEEKLVVEQSVDEKVNQLNESGEEEK